MKKKILWGKRIIASTVAAMLMAPVLTASAAGVTDILVDQVEHSDEQFDEYEYKRMVEADFDKIVDGLAELTADKANTDEVMDIITAMEDYGCEMGAYYTLAHINTTLDASNEEYEAELKYYDELAVNVGDKIMINYNMVAKSPCGPALEERIDNADDWQEILDYEPMTQEQKDLSGKETDLSLKYDELYNEDYTAIINGREFTEDEIEKAYEDGEIGMSDYLMGLADVTIARNEVLGELYLELVDVRTQIARSYGYDNYADYAYDKIYDRDYTPADLVEYREQVKEYMVPLEDELYTLLFEEYADERTAMFEQEITSKECLEKLKEHLPKISEDMLVSYNYMVEHNLCNLDVDDKKAPGGYTTSIQIYNAPYMFNCAEGDFSDMQTLVHEFGHYNQMYYGSEDFWYYGSNDLDLAEINSQGLEVLFMEYADDIYGEYGEVMNIYGAFNQTYSSIEGCKEDAFQYEVYKNADGLTLEKLNQIYYDCCMEYDDYDFYNSYYLGSYGFCDGEAIYEWVDVPHTFQSPMYYISYSVSMAAVEELRDLILKDRENGIKVYLELAEAGSDEAFQVTLDKFDINNPIKNPRCKQYADNVRVMLGLIDASSGSVMTDLDDATSDNDLLDDDLSDLSDQDMDEDIDEWYSAPKHNASIMIALFVVVSVVLVIVIIVIIIILMMNKKKEKQASSQSVVMSATNHNMGIPNNTQMYQGQPGMAQQNNGFMPGQPGMAQQNNGFMPGQQGMAQQNNGFMPGQPGVSQQNNSFMPGQQAMSQQAMSQQNNSFMPGQPGMSPQNNGFMPGQPGMSPQNNGFMPGQPGVSQQNNGFMPGQQAMPQQNSNFMPAQQNSSFVSNQQEMNAQNGSFMSNKQELNDQEANMQGSRDLSENQEIMNTDSDAIIGKQNSNVDNINNVN